ncbi:MAG: hypothetical protein U5J95_09665 [Balneolaceae bacterium]|nr:hypothetical protein [Balneolaceae bacterium]
MKNLFTSIVCSLLLIAGCTSSGNQSQNSNPPAPGFNADSSDVRAIAIADSVMKALGGREAWDDTKIISWNFFGRRTHTWNKLTGRDSIHIPSSELIIDMNISTKEGTVMKSGEEVAQPDSLQKYLQQGYQMWVNDAYWLMMPYKLKDSGVTLKYMGTDTTQTGIPSYKLKLTFDQVGVTPQNMYHVYVDTSDYMVRQWAYFPEADAEQPRFILPWKNYKKHGEIMLSGDRGQNKLTDIKVMDNWPDEN